MNVFDGEMDVAQVPFFEDLMGEGFLDLSDGGEDFSDGLGEHFVRDSCGEGIEGEDGNLGLGLVGSGVLGGCHLDLCADELGFAVEDVFFTDFERFGKIVLIEPDEGERDTCFVGSDGFLHAAAAREVDVGDAFDYVGSDGCGLVGRVRCDDSAVLVVCECAGDGR